MGGTAMGSELELYDARVSYIRSSEGQTAIHFSYALIHKTKGTPGRDTGRSWTQDSVLLLDEAELDDALPPFPNTVVEGFLEVNGARHELISLPFEQEGSARLHLEFIDGTTLDVRGENPVIKLEGQKIFLEGYT